MQLSQCAISLICDNRLPLIHFIILDTVVLGSRRCPALLWLVPEPELLEVIMHQEICKYEN